MAPLHSRLSAIAAVAVGGLLGTPLRYLFGVWFPHTTGTWPTATFAVNILGAFTLGLLLEALTRLGPDTGTRQRLRLCLGTGLLGSFTTYSTLAVDTTLLVRADQPGLALAYSLATVVIGLLTTMAGIAVAALVRPRPEVEAR
ncbi:fluoride efflux transporter CrcB [Nocardia sp. SSK8]|uniref:fluoride efflux transporter CrcB n=1 Tax=Nocardia sp. SSK8 TaxID=3120154 RepID=UPI00300ACBBB